MSAQFASIWSFADPIVQGIITAVTWALLVWVFAKVRDTQLKGHVRESLSNIGGAVWADEKTRVKYNGLVIHNDTHIPVTIRGVKVMFEPSSVGRVDSLTLNPMGPGESLYTSRTEADVRNFVELPAFTSGRWGTLAELGTHAPMFDPKIVRIVGCCITAHYLTLFKSPKVIEVEISDSHPMVKGFADVFAQSG